MKYQKLIITIIIVLVLLQNVQGFSKLSKEAKKAHKKAKKLQEQSKDTCPNFKMVSCAEKIKKTIMQCSSELDAMECVYNMLDGNNCYPCIDKVLPSFSKVEEDRKSKNKNIKYSEEVQQETQEINDVIHKFQTCGSIELFECKARVKRIVNKCKQGNDVHGCIDNKLQDDTCKVCLCKVSPEICTQEEQKDMENREKIQNDGKEDSFGFLGSIRQSLEQATQTLQNKQQKQEQKKQSNGFDIEQMQAMAGSLGMFGNLGQMAQKGTLNDLSNLAKMMESPDQQQSNKKTQGNSMNGLQQGMMIGMMQQFMNDPAKTQSLLDQLQINEDELESDDVNYDDLQQKITEKVMANPKILEQFLGNKYDMEEMQELLEENVPESEDYSEDYDEDYDEDYSEDYSEEEFMLEDQGYDDQCSQPKQQEQCKWKILKILPSCIGTDSKKCLKKVLKGHGCQYCICNTVPQAC